MARIWANRLIAGTKVWADVPENRKDEVRIELRARVLIGEITEEKYRAITGEDY